jgi:uncharacterized protein (DUF2062 family)
MITLIGAIGLNVDSNHSGVSFIISNKFILSKLIFLAAACCRVNFGILVGIFSTLFPFYSVQKNIHFSFVGCLDGHHF